jgi:hypothetical protein
MADLTPKVIESFDEPGFERDTGKVIRKTVVRYRLGELGPFRAEFNTETFTDAELDRVMQDKAAALRRFS